MLLLDIDGVLNPFAALDCPAGYTEHEVFPGEEPVRLCPAHGEWIAELAGPFEVVWASAWGVDANRLLGPLLDLPAFAHVDFPPTPFPPEMKVPFVIRHLRDRPAVWIDDVLTPEARNWVAARPTPTLLLAVDPAAGLTRHTVDVALQWAARRSRTDPQPHSD